AIHIKSTPDGKIVMAESGVNKIALVEIGGSGKSPRSSVCPPTGRRAAGQKRSALEGPLMRPKPAPPRTADAAGEPAVAVAAVFAHLGAVVRQPEGCPHL